MVEKQTILLVDDDSALTQALSIRCKAIGLEPLTAANGLEALRMIKKHPVDLMILDLDMPAADGFQVCRRMEDLDIDDIPIVVLTGRSDAETIAACNELGVDYMRKSSDIWGALEPKIAEMRSRTPSVRTATEPRAAGEPVAESPATEKILIVDDDPDITKALAMRLRYFGIETLVAANGIDGYMLAMKENPRVVITDYHMPAGSGDHMIVRMKQNRRTSAIPIIVLTGQTDHRGRNPSLERDILGRRGAAAFLAKPYVFEDLLAELQRHVPIRAGRADWMFENRQDDRIGGAA